MRPDRKSPSRRPHRALAVVATAVTAALAPIAPVWAQEAAGDTVVGELVQAWPETGGDVPGDAAHGDAGHGHDAAAGDAGHGHEAAPGDDASGNGDEAAGQPLSWVETPDGAVRVPTDAVGGLPVGATVAVTVGAPVDDAAGDEGYDPAHDVLDLAVVDPAPVTGPAPAGSLTNEVTVAMVVPRGGTRDRATLRQVVAAVDGPVADFWAEQTDGAVRIGVTAAHDWTDTEAGCADPTALWDEVAERVGFRAGPGRHLAVYLSSLPRDLPGCSYALAQVGSGPGAGGRMYVREVLPSVLAHEFGHNLGLGHSSGRQCDGAVETGTCRTAPYRDYYDVMGASWQQVGSLNAPQAAALGVLPASARRALAAGDPEATVTLAPLAGREGTRALRLTDTTSATYWLEYRTAGGRDAWLAAPENRYGLQPGVLLRRAGGLPDTALLLDGTPAAAAGWDDDLQAALPVGVPVPVAGGAFAVTVRDVAPTGATVTVTPAAAAAAAPALPQHPGAPDVLPAAPAAAPVAATGAPGTVDLAPATSAVPADPDVAPAPAVSTDAEAATQPAASTSAGPGWGATAPAAAGVAVAGLTSWAGIRIRAARARG